MKSRTRNKLVRGVGVNDADYQTSISEMIDGRQKRIWRCKLCRVWEGMLDRCYSEKYQAKQPTYVGCEVVEEWLNFSVFRNWMVTQPWEGNELDKDILIPGNKVYGPDTCVFVPCGLNLFMTDRGSLRGEFPIGVCWDKDRGMFIALCRNPFTGKQENLGRFTDPAAAHEAWRKRKHELACRYADMQTDPRIAQALRTRYATPAGEFT